MNQRTLIAVLWAVVLFEIVSPLPAVLTLGAVYVLIARPPWFPELVRRIYRSGDEPARPDR